MKQCKPILQYCLCISFCAGKFCLTAHLPSHVLSSCLPMLQSCNMTHTHSVCLDVRRVSEEFRKKTSRPRVLHCRSAHRDFWVHSYPGDKPNFADIPYFAANSVYVITAGFRALNRSKKWACAWTSTSSNRSRSCCSQSILLRGVVASIIVTMLWAQPGSETLFNMSADVFESALDLEVTHFVEGHQQGLEWVASLQGVRPAVSVQERNACWDWSFAVEMERRLGWVKAESWACKRAGRLVRKSAFMLGVCRYAICKPHWEWDQLSCNLRATLHVGCFKSCSPRIWHWMRTLRPALHIACKGRCGASCSREIQQLSHTEQTRAWPRWRPWQRHFHSLIQRWHFLQTSYFAR